MHHHLHLKDRSPLRTLAGALARVSCVAVGSLSLCGTAAAVDFGPFSLTGFAKAELTRVSPYCKDNNCQRDPLAQKEYIWADDLMQGKTFGAGNTSLTLFQPWLTFKHDLPRGFKVDAFLSQRWRDGKPDFKGFVYERNVAISHEDYGSLRVGAMTTRGWAMADYPYGSDVNVADAWGSSGAGYGLLTRAFRYTSRPFDVAEGDLVVEGTYDMGETGWRRNKPRFLEMWVHYGKGDLTLDAIVQNTKNGTPSAFGHGPFTGPFYDPVADPLIGGNSQGIAMLMGRYRVDSKLEILGGVRANRWSGAYAKFLFPAATNPLGIYDLWSNAFNVDWSTDLGGGVYKGHSARSTDLMVGARYRMGKWVASTGMVHLGKARTDNPSERGQSNSATINTVGLKYEMGRGVEFYGFAGMVNYGRRGLAPTSMPANAAFTNIDSRVKRRGNWFGVGAVYTF
jgi:predicted porin